MWDIQLFKLNFDDREVEAVKEVVSGGWLSMGEKILDFEIVLQTNLVRIFFVKL